MSMSIYTAHIAQCL